MFIRIFGLFVLVFALFGTQSQAATSTCVATSDLDVPPPPSCPNTFTSGNGGVTTGVYDFTATGDGKLIVSFDTVLDMFTLTVTVNHTIDPLDPNEFPSGTVCVQYSGNGSKCDQYDFTGSANGPNGVPVRNTDYKGLITLTLSYLTDQTVHTPAFGHAPGDISTFTEDILTSYFSEISDPTMGGKTPGLSSVVALDEPLTVSPSDNICNLSTGGFTFSASTTKEIEVTFQLFSGACNTGTPLRDKTARFSLSYFDPISGNLVFPPLVDKEEGNKFHWDNTDGLNEFDFGTAGLPTGVTYTVTVISSKASPQSTTFTLTP